MCHGVIKRTKRSAKMDPSERKLKMEPYNKKNRKAGVNLNAPSYDIQEFNV